MTVLLLHGASGNATTWDPVLRATGLQARALDLPGRGDSHGPPRDRVEHTAAWLAEQLSGTDPAVVVGHSYGGAVALQLALDAPDRVRAVVLVASASRLRVHPSILEAVAASTPEAPYRLDAAFSENTPADAIAAYHRLAATTPPASALADWTACNHFDVRARLGELTFPVLVLHGDQDVLTVPKHQALLADALAAGTRQVVPGAGHMLPWEAPTAFAEAVSSWIDAL